MTHSFQLFGIGHEQFEPLFLLTEEQLKAHGAERRIATESPGYPCRVSLEDAAVGEELLLLPYFHHPVASPYRASGPIFVRRGAKQKTLRIGEVPRYVSMRLISVRAYDAAHLMVDATVCEGTRAAEQIDNYFGNEQVDYIHLHNAKQGCFSCQVVRGGARVGSPL